MTDYRDYTVSIHHDRKQRQPLQPPHQDSVSCQRPQTDLDDQGQGAAGKNLHSMPAHAEQAAPGPQGPRRYGLKTIGKASGSPRSILRLAQDERNPSLNPLVVSLSNHIASNASGDYPSRFNPWMLERIRCMLSATLSCALKIAVPATKIDAPARTESCAVWSALMPPSTSMRVA